MQPTNPDFQFRADPFFNGSAVAGARRPLTGFTVEQQRGDRWVKLALYTGALDDAKIHAANAYGGTLRILGRSGDVVWARDGSNEIEEEADV